MADTTMPPAQSAPQSGAWWGDSPAQRLRRTRTVLVGANFAWLAFAAWWVIGGLFADDPSGATTPGLPAATPDDVRRPVLLPPPAPARDLPHASPPGVSPAAGSGQQSGSHDPGVTSGGGAPAVSHATSIAARPPAEPLAVQRRMLEKAIAALGPPLETSRLVRGAYPTSNRAEFGANRGIEALLEEFAERGGVDAVPLATGDTDGDGRPEFLDPWGRPLLYVSADDYGTPQDVTGVGVVGARRGGGSTAGAAGANGTAATWRAERRYQIVSVGPDGKDDHGAGDDVGSWFIEPR